MMTARSSSGRSGVDPTQPRIATTHTRATQGEHPGAYARSTTAATRKTTRARPRTIKRAGTHRPHAEGRRRTGTGRSCPHRLGGRTERRGDEHDNGRPAACAELALTRPALVAVHDSWPSRAW